MIPYFTRILGIVLLLNIVFPSSGNGQSMLEDFKYMLDTLAEARYVTDPHEPFEVVDLAILDSNYNRDLPEDAFIVEPDLEDANPEMRLVLKSALSYLGVPYVYGGTSREGVDCSGLIFLAFQAADKKVPRTSKTLAKEGKTINWTDLKPGDLIFFSPNLNKNINHVGLVIRNTGEDVLFVHSTSSAGEVVKNWLRDPYWWKRFRKARRLSWNG